MAPQKRGGAQPLRAAGPGLLAEVDEHHAAIDAAVRVGGVRELLLAEPDGDEVLRGHRERGGQRVAHRGRPLLAELQVVLARAGGIGVADDGTILGLDNDYQTLKRQDQDGFEQAIMSSVSTNLGADLCQFVQVLFHVIHGKDICRLIIHQAPRPVFLKQGNGPKFFLRTGGGTRDLNIQEATEFIATRWNK